MRLRDYILLAVVAALAYLAFRVWRGKAKRGGCCGGCSGDCAHCASQCRRHREKLESGKNKATPHK